MSFPRRPLNGFISRKSSAWKWKYVLRLENDFPANGNGFICQEMISCGRDALSCLFRTISAAEIDLLCCGKWLAVRSNFLADGNGFIGRKVISRFAEKVIFLSMNSSSFPTQSFYVCQWKSTDWNRFILPIKWKWFFLLGSRKWQSAD